MEGAALWGISHGLGAHLATMEHHEIQAQLKLLLSAIVTWTLATTLCKLAVMWLYTQIFTTRRFRQVTYIAMGFIALFPIIYIPVGLTNCQPIDAFWSLDPAYNAANCGPLINLEYGTVATNMFLDLMVVCFPIPMVWKLQMPTRKKFFVSGMFSIGLIIVAIMVWRIVFTYQTRHDTDFNYNLYYISLQSNLELWLGIMAANLPTLAPLYTRYIMPRVKTYFFSSRSSKKPSHPRSNKYMSRTFGSNGPDIYRDKFNRLDDESLEFPVELIEGQHTAKIEAGTPRRSMHENGIGFQRDVEISVEDIENFEQIQKHTRGFS
ncbi:hypothetical protein M501DRAFT_1002156 [Patellaria atrata CBS 101060]|uniref:Rhodopsin domain-containing protein n=1 Tax=Patellaria atrata CBS 101060 TaxID=1346257 RepID=A0A9P4SFY7_9PEZI|nr:hypothetical protein M501DRAFT_1002156 [Patellaria atrata CBS 101060]